MLCSGYVMHGGGEMLELRDAIVRIGSFQISADFCVAEGARCAILGPSGAGKSTLLMALAGFTPLASGEVMSGTGAITHLPPAARPFALLFQDNNLFPHLTVAQNVGLALSPSLKLNTAQKARVEDALKDVGLERFGTRKPGELSGGQQSRAALARVLLQAKPWLFLDEPFSALGPALKADMLDLVADLCSKSGAGLLMISHDPGDALRICPKTIIVSDGIARAPQDTHQLLQDPPDDLRAYLGT